MTNIRLIDSVAVATEVLGTAAVKVITDLDSAVRKTEKVRTKLADYLFGAGFTADLCKAPKGEKGAEIVEVAGVDHTRQEIFDSLKYTVAAGRGKLAESLWNAPKGSLSTAKSAEKIALVKSVGSVVGGDIHKALLKKAEQVQLDKLQDAEDALAKKEGREPELVTAKAGESTRSPDVRINEFLTKAKDIAQKLGEDTKVDFDITALVKAIDAAIVIVATED